MDPASLGIGVVSLTFQVFSGCVKGYQLLTEARDMPKEHQYLRIRLKQEQYRLLDWARVAHISETDNNLVLSNASRGVLCDVLYQKNQLLLAFGKFDDKYKPLRRPLLSDEPEEVEDSPVLKKVETGFNGRFPQTEDLLKRALEWIDKSSKYPKRLKWASWDKAKFEQLLLKLSSFNDFMKGLLNDQQLDQLIDLQTRTEFQIIQLNSKVDQLLEFVRAGTAWQELTQTGPQTRTIISTDPLKALLQARGLMDLSYEPSEQNLAALARFKALGTAINTNGLTDDIAQDLELGETVKEITSVELSHSDIRIIDQDNEDQGEFQRTEALYVRLGSMRRPGIRRKQVWIEWKTFEPQAFDGEPDPMILERIRALTALLKENNRSGQFRAPQCLGYFRDIDPNGEDRYRFGLVFEKPNDVQQSTRPVSLLDLLRDESIEMPSLTQRIALACVVAECLERLHAVNWLHKGLRSHNILFFHNAHDPELDLSAPYISGFDYSRPAQNEDMTEKPPENAAYDLYRHPHVQSCGSTPSSSSRSGFKKSFDIYALGVILLEIAHWKPIDEILGLGYVRMIKPSATLAVRGRLLREPRFLGYVRSHLGDVLAGVVHACLEGPGAFGLHEDVDEKDEIVGEQLGIAFYAEVVGKLKGIKV
ncbi:uncharacterized protein K452DRAFT_244554 [Aplosporella prunicola CBS 121167]|uniref:Protein kinase domain-containing protein n=1 Tax=Aplosporella prunicola CBS 121167 TaxID=1176127 RepID=A0A6A6BLK7_9PEZI|nr:uncharacterized protein K452DRAFT_244554 [Aplosporella prunicola CBS 121167]KAF2145002.1 hypothetical protein K452DRAFT_244554 [Aplosporella prunicola CBS 121167]